MWFRKKRIYADAAAATPLSEKARAEMLRLLPLYGNPGAIHTEALEAKRELDLARARIARAIGAHADEIVFTASGTEANNLALHGARGHAITSAIEHQSVLEPLRATGASVTELPVDREGVIDIAQFKESLREDTSIVSIQLVNSEVGTIQPIQELRRHISRRRRSGPLGQVLPSPQDVSPPLFHTDASQAPLWLPVNVEVLGVDLLTLDAQKMLGPKGVGALYIRRGVEVQPLIRGGGQEGGLRGGTENVPLIGAFAVALEEAQKDVEARALGTAAVRDYLWGEIKRLIPGAILNGPAQGARRSPNNLNISIPGLEAQMAVVSLDAQGIAAGTRSACDSGDEDPSHVIVALGTPPALATSAVRITLLPTATEVDARAIAAALAHAAALYRAEQ
ncbi:MAG: cysteine desulfurase [Patescibacteria group bacterium]|nr:cysteine desulfurase [Patescibacteria group bacterium]